MDFVLKTVRLQTYTKTTSKEILQEYIPVV